MLVPNSGHVAGEGRVAEVVLVVNIGTVCMRTVYHSSGLAQLDGGGLHSLKVLSVETAISTGRIACSSLNKDKPVGVIDNGVTDPLCSFIEVSILVSGVPSNLEGLDLDIDGKDIPGISVPIC